MFCKQCGSPIDENDKFCKNCGAVIVPITEKNPEAPSNEVPNQASTIPLNENNSDVVSSMNQIKMPQNMNNANPNPQPWMNNYNIPQKKNYTPFFIAGVIIVVIIILAVSLLIAWNNKEDNNNNNNNNNNYNSTNNNQTTTPTFTSNTYKVRVGNYIYELPDDLIYSTSGDYIVIGDSEGTWAVQMSVENSSLSLVEGRMDQAESYFEERGAIVDSVQKQTINGVEYITIAFELSGLKMLAAYAYIDASHVAYMTVVDLYNEYNYDVLDVLAPTISSIKYSNTSVGIEAANNMDLSILESFINEG